MKNTTRKLILSLSIVVMGIFFTLLFVYGLKTIKAEPFVETKELATTSELKTFLYDNTDSTINVLLDQEYSVVTDTLTAWCITGQDFDILIIKIFEINGMIIYVRTSDQKRELQFYEIIKEKPRILSQNTVDRILKIMGQGIHTGYKVDTISLGSINPAPPLVPLGIADPFLHYSVTYDIIGDSILIKKSGYYTLPGRVREIDTK